MTRLLVIFATVAGTLSIQTDPLMDEAVANFTALLGNPDVHKFIDKVMMDAPPPPSPGGRELDEDLGGEVLASSKDDYPFCSNCKTIQSTAISAYFQQQITDICRGPGGARSSSTEAFCYFLKEGTPELNQVLNGYIFVRSRALQLAISTCIGRGQCPTEDAYNAFFNPIVPGRLVDFTRFKHCPSSYQSLRNIDFCFALVTIEMLLFAYSEVLVACDKQVAEGLDEFCGYIKTDVAFGIGLVFGYVGVYEQATGYCVRDRCW
ncbi:hypothetical protein FOZ62_029407 [Perkinsus olseni]|uniref:Uncharacterized protein n=1 Tax=Perkinsus olseni TaxID=32597 RepID=A0A7J6QM82_PEROL|nr:hypothetical protein FOZ62_029407 [Perkinsus olseni]